MESGWAREENEVGRFARLEDSEDESAVASLFRHELDRSRPDRRLTFDREIAIKDRRKGTLDHRLERHEALDPLPPTTMPTRIVDRHWTARKENRAKIQNHGTSDLRHFYACFVFLSTPARPRGAGELVCSKVRE